jgi:pseudouridine-5'-phosphate glycosidase
MSTAPSPVGVAVSAEVEAALASGGAVVALESTIISHGTPRSPSEQSRAEEPPLRRCAFDCARSLTGVSVAGMPYPKNLQTAMEVEAIVRENGAVPATIAILDGVPHVGKLYRFPIGIFRAFKCHQAR